MSPFDEARYARLLEGLDATEIALSKLLEGNEVFRIDAEYFGTEALAVIGRLRGHGAVPLASLAAITDGIHTSLPFVDDGTVKVLSAKHPKENYIDRSQFETISAEFHAQNPRTALRKNDVLISTVGTIGNSAVVTADLLPANSDRHIGIVRLHKGAMSPYLLSTFLLSRYGKTQSVRETTGNVQPNLFISKIEQLLIPRFSEQFERATTAKVQLAYQLREESAEKRGQAEKVLLHALGLHDWEAPGPLSYIRSSGDAFTAGRLDAEFFTPRVRDMLARLGRDGLTIRDVAPARKERFTPADSGDFHYIEIGGLSADGTAQAECLPQREAPSRATQYVRAGDVITSTVRPIRRLSAAIDASQDGYVCSSGFVVLQPRAIRSDVLLTYLRLPPVCALMDLHTSASMYPAISEADLLALPIPKIPEATQQVIEESVLAARQAKQRATQLLNAAKRAVEIAIEDSEAAALAYLETIAANTPSCEDAAHDLPTNPASQSTTPGLARPTPGRGQPARGLSGEGAGFHAELHGAGKRAGGSAAPARSPDSTQPLDATRTLSTVAGPLPYSEVAEALAENVARCLDELFETAPEDITLTPETLRAFHQRIAGALFPDWAGTWRTGEVQVGTHYPPPPHDVAVQVRNFCLDLEERLRHVDDAQAIAALLAWADWRFQWIHPFKDFNGRVGRILLVALTYHLGLPPLDPAGATLERQAYFDALRQADGGDLHPLTDLWMGRLQEQMNSSDTSQ